jgi:hypothetical protein
VRKGEDTQMPRSSLKNVAPLIARLVCTKCLMTTSRLFFRHSHFFALQVGIATLRPYHSMTRMDGTTLLDAFEISL